MTHTMESSAMARQIRTHLNELAAALIARGLTVRVGRGGVSAANPASRAEDPLGDVLHPGLSQEVALSVHEDRTFHWYWAWSGPTRDAPRELEYMLPAADIAEAAARIARVLAVTTA
jgi:hypothetical protein